MKYILSFLTILLFSTLARAQGGHDISGTVIDTTKLTVPGATVKIKTDKGDSTIRVTGIDGKFTFTGVTATKVTMTITSIGYQGIIKHFVFAADNKPMALGNVVLKTASTILTGVTIVGINPVVLKEDTTQYSAAAYPVRENAPVEDLVKKLPGVDVDKDGNITTKGKTVTKIRINGKDVFGGDVTSITKNLPADVVENIQMIDDYGDQANLTGVKTGDPTQIMNITIRKDKNYGYSNNMTAGDGRDALPKPQTDGNRYVGMINAFKFKGDQQIYLLGNLNNVNANTFTFGGGGNGGGGGFGGGGGGGRGNAARGSGTGTTAQNGITNVHTVGLNFRDQWGKNLSVYGSYSFADNTTNTNSTSLQSNTSQNSSSLNNQGSREHDLIINHRFTWNMEWKPDTVNYVKLTPTFSYSGTKTNYADTVANSKTLNGVSSNTKYTSTTYSNLTSPNYGLTVLYNHRFNGHGRNFSITASGSSVSTDQYQNPIYQYLLGAATAPANQNIYTYSRVNSTSSNLSYLEPIGPRSYLELNYNISYSYTTSDKETDTLSVAKTYNNYPFLSNDYNYSFLTNKVGLNYRFIEKKYNLTLGLGVQPSVLDGYSPKSGISTHVTNFNVIPTARYVYNFSRSQAFNATYSGSSNQPTFNQLQPVTDFSNALYPVQGNPNLRPEFNNTFNIRYNAFSFATGNVLFLNFNYTQTDNKIATNTTTYPATYTPDKNLANTILSTYLNTSGFYSASGFFNYTKPWEQRKYSLSVGGNVTYNNNVGFISTVAPTTYTMTTEKNIGKNLVLTPNLRFRTDITDVIDAQFLTSYSINKTDNSVQTTLTQASSNVRAWNIGLSGKNYLWKNWTVSYDYTKTLNYGYTVPVTNPNILTMYLERRFLKNNMATIRLSGVDLFNQNAGYSLTSSANSLTETSANRLGRYYLLTFNIRLQKFAGKAPSRDMGPDGRPRGDGGGRGGFGGGPGGGGPGGSGGFGGPQ